MDPNEWDEDPHEAETRVAGLDEYGPILEQEMETAMERDMETVRPDAAEVDEDAATVPPPEKARPAEEEDGADEQTISDPDDRTEIDVEVDIDLDGL